MKAVILFNQVNLDDRPDETDVLEQVNFINEMLISLGHSVSKLGITADLSMASLALKAIQPDFVFNLVEALDGKEELISVAPLLLETLNIPFTGARSVAMFLTSHKLLAKEIMMFHHIPTAPFFRLEEFGKTDSNKKYLVKPINKDGSVGIDDDLIFQGKSEALINYVSKLRTDDFFIEEYIHGREFNISVIAGKPEVEVLPLAEIIFENYPDEKPRILGYKSKWENQTFEYQNTIRKFNTLEHNETLQQKLRSICKSCWKVFKLKGYARVDIRIDEKNNPYVLEINANPCITPEAGFYSACLKAGYQMQDVVKRIIEDI